MKKLALILVLLSSISFANNNALGVWVDRYNWGIDIKHLSDKNNAWDIYLRSFSIGSDLDFGADFGYYWLFNFIKADASMGSFPLHFGPDIGLNFQSHDDWNGFGIWGNAVGGISWFTPTTPKMDVSFELALPIISYTDYGKSSFGFLKDNINFRLLFHVYFF